MRGIEAWVGVAVLLMTALAPTVLFWHRERAYASGKEGRLPSPTKFRRVDRGLRIAGVIVGGAALLTTSPMLLEWHHSPSWVFAGIVVVAAGLALLLSAKRALGFNYSPCFDGYMPFAVVDGGPYRIFRHPMYVAYLMISAGVCVLTGTAWLIIGWIVWLRWFRQAAVIEESELAHRFPDYRAYIRRTPRFLPTLSARPLAVNTWPPERKIAAAPESLRSAPAQQASSAPDAA